MRSLADTVAPRSICRSAEYKLIGRLNLSAILTAIGDGHDRQVSPVFSKPGEGAIFAQALDEDAVIEYQDPHHVTTS